MTEEKKKITAQDKNEVIKILRPGMTVKVSERIKDVDVNGKEKERSQIFEGIILALHRLNTPSATMTVRKISEGIGVEKIYPLHSPLVEKITPVKQARVRRAKLYYLRDYKKHIKEEKI